MNVRLLVVTDTFQLRGRGVLLEPRITIEPDAGGSFAALLRLPDGTERQTRGVIELAHVQAKGGGTTFALVRLPDLGPDDVPPGTEVWRPKHRRNVRPA